MVSTLLLFLLLGIPMVNPLWAEQAPPLHLNFSLFTFRSSLSYVSKTFTPTLFKNVALSLSLFTVSGFLFIFICSSFFYSLSFSGAIMRPYIQNFVINLFSNKNILYYNFCFGNRNFCIIFKYFVDCFFVNFSNFLLHFITLYVIIFPK